MTGVIASVQTSADTAPLGWLAALLCLLTAVLVVGALYGYAAYLAERDRVREESARSLNRLGYRRAAHPRTENRT